MLLLYIIISTVISGINTQIEFLDKRSPPPMVTTTRASESGIPNPVGSMEYIMEDSKKSDDFDANPAGVPNPIGPIESNLEYLWKVGDLGNPNQLKDNTSPELKAPAFVVSQELGSISQEPMEYTSSNMETGIDLIVNSELASRFSPSKRQRINRASVTQYKLLLNLTTVPQVWQEYKYGMNGKQSIESLVEKHGIVSLKSQSEKRLYYRRKAITDYIIGRLADGQSEEDAVNKVEEFRLENKWTLIQLQEYIVMHANDNPLQTIPKYKMLRNLTTVPEVWQEYKYGINGNPSVESLDERYGTSWRSSNAEYQYYLGRGKIYHHLLDAIANGTAEVDAVNELEALRVAQKWSLYKLQFSIPLLSFDEATGKLIPAKPVYQLMRNLTTVPQVWQEYQYGLNGNPSFKSILQNHGKTWLQSASEAKYYNRRKKIYRYIMKAFANGKSEEDAVNELEDFRKSNNMTLWLLQEHIKLPVDEGEPYILMKENASSGVQHPDDESMFADILQLLE